MVVVKLKGSGKVSDLFSLEEDGFYMWDEEGKETRVISNFLLILGRLERRRLKVKEVKFEMPT